MVVLAALVAAVFFAAPAQAANWSDLRYMSDCDDNGCMTVGYRVDLSQSTGYQIDSVKIMAAGTSSGLVRIDGHGLSCWNENSVIKWQRSGADTDLNPGQVKKWLPGTILPDAHKLVCGWTFTQVFTNKQVNGCTKVLDTRSDPPVSGGC